MSEVAAESRDEEFGQQNSIAEEDDVSATTSERISFPHECAAKFPETEHHQSVLQR